MYTLTFTSGLYYVITVEIFGDSYYLLVYSICTRSHFLLCLFGDFFCFVFLGFFCFFLFFCGAGGLGFLGFFSSCVTNLIGTLHQLVSFSHGGIRSSVVALWTAGEQAAIDRSCSKGMIPDISPGYSRPSIASQVQDLGLKHYSFHFSSLCICLCFSLSVPVAVDPCFNIETVCTIKTGLESNPNYGIQLLQFCTVIVIAERSTSLYIYTHFIYDIIVYLYSIQAISMSASIRSLQNDPLQVSGVKWIRSRSRISLPNYTLLSGVPTTSRGKQLGTRASVYIIWPISVQDEHHVTMDKWRPYCDQGHPVITRVVSW